MQAGSEGLVAVEVEDAEERVSRGVALVETTAGNFISEKVKRRL